MIITNKDYYEDWLRIKKELDLIFQGLEVEEDGVIRPPTAEEVRELIDYVLGNAIYEYERLWKRMINSTYKVEFTLKSGAILRMKGVK